MYGGIAQIWKYRPMYGGIGLCKEVKKYVWKCRTMYGGTGLFMEVQG